MRPSELLSDTSQRDHYFAVGRWRWSADSRQGQLSWDGCSVPIEIPDKVGPGPLRKTPARGAPPEVKQGDVVLLKLKRLAQSLRMESLDVLAPNQDGAQVSELTADRIDILRRWALFKVLIRAFFLERSFIEVETPTLVPCPGTEPYLNPFKVEGTPIRYLPTSPELHLKKALSQGLDAIFEMKACFRGGEKGELHQTEFLMLEWYRSFSSLATIHWDLQELLSSLAQSMESSLDTRIQAQSVQDLFKEHCNFDLRADTTGDDLLALSSRLGLGAQAHEPWDDLFFRIFVDRIEPQMARSEQPLLVYNFPPHLAAYSRIGQDGWAQRFELYWHGYEICNAFQELNDPSEQARRFFLDLEKKKSLDKPLVNLDEEFLSVLQRGFPPAAGIALGVERLFMVFAGIQDIRDLKLFPY